MKKFSSVSILVLFVLLVALGKMAFAEGGIAWDPAGVKVCTAPNNQQNIRMVRDDSGGAIIVWQDYRNGSSSGFDIYAQRIDKNGTPKWYPDGVVVCNFMEDQKNPVIVGDGYGGAIIAWEDYRNVSPDIYALRISSGDGGPYPSWPAGGVAVSAFTTESERYPDIVNVGSAEVVVVWQHDTGFGEYSIRGQKMSGFGASLWVGGVIVSSGTAPKEFPKIIDDGMGYVIVTWQDCRFGNFDIYAQRIYIYDATIPVPWDPNGQPVSTVTASDQKNPQIASDSLGGAVIVWEDYRNTTGPDIYAQRISSGAVRLWDAGYGNLEGIPVCKMDGEQKNPVIVSRLSAGTIVGAIFTWEDRRFDPNGDIYATGIDLDFGLDWTGEDMPIATGDQIQIFPRLVNDIQGGGIGAWIERSPFTNQYQIFATKRGQDGVLLWNSYPGVLVYQGSRIIDHQIVKDDAGGIIVAWQAGSSGNYDIFAQRVIEDAYTRSASICGRVTLSDGETGITGVEVWALKGEELVSSAITDTKGYYKITGLAWESVYLVRANWSTNGIETGVGKEAFAPSYSFDFTLELNYELGTIAGNVSGVEREAKRVSGLELYESLSPSNGVAFVELEQRGKVIVRVPLEMDGIYSIPNLLPGRFIARAYNGTIYSNSRIVDLSEGETLRVDFAFGMMPKEEVYNYPNPAKGGSTTIRYYCAYADPEAEIKIYNISGELVREVEDNEIDETDAPIYRFLWDCENSSGKEVASGIYIYMVEVKEKGGSESKKVVKRMAVIR